MKSFIRKFRGTTYFVAPDVRFAVSDVLPDGSMEQDVVLQHEANLIVKRFLFQLTQIESVDPHRSSVGFVKPSYECGNRAFPRPGWTDECGHPSGFGLSRVTSESIGRSPV
jgi:hypothetical protein